MLSRVGAVASSLLRGSDVAGRMGGDEFAVLLLETGKHGGSRFLRRFREGLAELVADGNIPVGLGFSAGCANYPEEAETFTDLLRLADARQYEVKRQYERLRKGSEMPGEVAGKLRPRLDPRAAERMRERELRGVQELPREPGLRRAVGRVARDG